MAEAYPDLKANQGFQQLRASLVEIEDQLQYARRYYNGAVRDYNILVESFPSQLVARLFGFKPAAFFEVDSPLRAPSPGGPPMKSLVGLPASFAALLAIVLASASLAGERLLSFDSRILVRPDASLLVRETIRVRAEGNKIRHGVYREFPQLYHSQLGLNVKTGFDVTSVRRDGQPESYHIEDRENGKRVYFGSPKVNLRPGEYTYELTYQTDRQLGFFDDHDELYWNATGNGWLFPIDRASATVTLPDGAKITSVTAYTGPTAPAARTTRARSSRPTWPPSPRRGRWVKKRD